MPTEEEILAKVFNAGYQMQKHEPVLLDKILKSNNPDGNYMDALAKGKQQAQRDKIIAQQRLQREKQQEKKRGI